LELFNINSDKKLYFLPDLNNIHLDSLSLMRYRCEFRGILPSEIHFEECYIENSANLSGCKKMTLLSTSWNTPSIPSEELILEDVKFTGVPEKLKKLSMNNAMINAHIHTIDGLEELKIINHDFKANNCLLSFPPTLKTLIIDYEYIVAKNLVLNNGLEVLFIRGPREKYNHMISYPPMLKELTIYNAVISLEELISQIPKSVEKLFLKRCIFRAPVYHVDKTNVFFASHFKYIEISNCTDEENLYLTFENGISEVLVVASKLNISDNTFIIYTKTQFPLMTEHEFAQMCHKSSKEEFFKDYLDYLDDFRNLENKTKKYDKYIELFHSFPYNIQAMTNVNHVNAFLTYAHNNSTILLSGKKWAKKDIMASIQSNNTHPVLEKFLLILKQK